MDFLLHLQGVLFSLCTRQLYRILQSELGLVTLSFFYIFLKFSNLTHHVIPVITVSKLIDFLKINDGSLGLCLCSSRIASRGILLADSQSAEIYGENSIRNSEFQASAVTELPSTSTSGQSVTTLTRLKEKLSEFWLHVVQRWPAVH